MATPQEIAETNRRAQTKLKEADRQRLEAENKMAKEAERRADQQMKEAQAKAAEADRMASANNSSSSSIF